MIDSHASPRVVDLFHGDILYSDAHHTDPVADFRAMASAGIVYFLYIKTHNVTGKKYLGYTKSRDPHAYKGSGKWWERHIAKHGYDVTTEIVGAYTSKEEVKERGLYLSHKLNIVESIDWLNLKLELADGGFDFINNHGLNGSKMGVAVLKLRAAEGTHPCLGRKQSTEERNRRSAIGKGRRWSEKAYANSIETRRAKGVSTETREKMRIANTGSRWVTDGKVNLKIKNNEVPPGFRIGRTL